MTSIGTLDCVDVAGSANAAASSNLPSSGSYDVQTTKPSVCVMHVVGPVDVSTPPPKSDQRAVNRDDYSRQLTAARSLLTLSQHPVQSDDRPTSAHSQLTRSQLRDSSVQRSHSFTTTSHQLPTNAGPSDCCYFCCVNTGWAKMDSF